MKDRYFIGQRIKIWNSINGEFDGWITKIDDIDEVPGMKTLYAAKINENRRWFWEEEFLIAEWDYVKILKETVFK